MISFDPDVLIEWLDSHAEYRADTGFEYNYTCPFCGGTEFFINIDSGAWVCHHMKRCGERSRSPAQLVSRVDGISVAEAIRLLEGDGGAVVNNETVQDMLAPEVLEHTHARTLSAAEMACPIEGGVPFDVNSSEPDQVRARDFLWHKRKFDPAWFAQNYYPFVGLWGYTEGRFIIPHLRDGYPIFYQARDMTGEQEPKYRNPPSDIIKVPRKELVWNEVRLQAPQRTVVIAEGIFKAVAFERAGYAAVATYGAGVNKSQLYQLVNSPTSMFVVAPDKGKAGPGAVSSFAEMWRDKLSKPLAAHGKLVYQITPFENCDYDEAPVEWIHEAVSHARLINGPYAV